MAIDLVNHRKKKQLLQRYNVQRFILCPMQWKAYKNPAALTWKRVRFAKGSIPKVPNSSGGVYAFVVKPRILSHPAFNYLLYIGETSRQTLQDRFKNYFYEGSQAKPRYHVVEMLDDWRRHDPFQGGLDHSLS